MRVAQDITELIGSTPLMQANRIMREENLAATLLLKLESFNPLSSAKDRAALFMLRDAEEKGILKPGGTLVEPTSGNTGIGLAYLCTALGYRLILTMPESMSLERRNLLKALGAELVLTSAEQGMNGAVEKAQQLCEEIPGALILGQFDNQANARAHYCTTGPEIWDDTDGKVDVFVAAIGTGGTITGVGRALKEKKTDVRVIGVEPDESPLLTRGVAGAHGIQGIGANFVPSVLDRAVVDEIVTVTTQDAMKMAKRAMCAEGVFCGISAGAALCAGIAAAKRPENRGKTIVVLLPDTGERYLSSGIFD